MVLVHSPGRLLSDNDMLLEEISRLIGHKSTVVTELAYRKQIRPAMQSGAEAMGRIFSPAPVRRRAIVTHLVTQQAQRRRCDAIGVVVIWWGYVDLNHGPLPYQGSALTD
jgi:hypothetical protein